jgi:hypothetical protein
VHLIIRESALARVLPFMDSASRLAKIIEQYYSPKDVAGRVGLSARFVREYFCGKPGVLTIDRPEQMHKRGYSTIRIPESAVREFVARLANK